MPQAYIGIGSNLGDPAANVRLSIEKMGGIGQVSKESSFYRTKAWGVTDQPDFCNAVIAVITELTPLQLIAALKNLEADLGRTPTYRWGPRIIDLDILTYDDITIDDPQLKIPHPGLLERATVLVPLAEIDPAYAKARDALPADALADVHVIEDHQRW